MSKKGHRKPAAFRIEEVDLVGRESVVCGTVPDTTFLQPDLLYVRGELREGLVLAVGADGNVRDVLPAAQAPQATRLPGRALLPGFVNAHSHAFQRLIRLP